MQAFLATLIVLISPSFGAQTTLSVMLRSQARVHRMLNRASPDASAAARTLQTLDTNHDGKVDPQEVAAFARTQGLDPEAVTKEFASLDKDGDGVLNAEELSVALGIPRESSTAPVQPQAIQKDIVKSVPKTFDQALPANLDSEGSELSATKSKENSLANLEQAMPAKLDSEGSELTATKSKESSLESSEQSAAGRLAQELSQQLSLETTREHQAEQLDHLAAELRANATSVARQTQQKALEAGSQAAKRETSHIMKQLADLEDKAKESEVEAAKLRAKSKAELQQADSFMAVADAALKGDTSAANKL